MTSRFRPFGWADFWAAVIVALMLWAVSDAYAQRPHYGHAWRIVEYEYVYDSYNRPIKRCVWECTTNYGEPHYAITRSSAGSDYCPMPM